MQVHCALCSVPSFEETTPTTGMALCLEWGINREREGGWIVLFVAYVGHLHSVSAYSDARMDDLFPLEDT